MVHIGWVHTKYCGLGFLVLHRIKAGTRVRLSPVLTLEQLGRDKSAGRVHGPAQAREETKLQDETRRAEASADSFSTEGRKCGIWTPCGVYRSNWWLILVV